MANSCDGLISNLEDLIELRHISMLKFFIFGAPSMELESKEWAFEGQFIRMESARFDMNSLSGYRIVPPVLSLFFEE
jgi:hypothetical protein